MLPSGRCRYYSRSGYGHNFNSPVCVEERATQGRREWQRKSMEAWRQVGNGGEERAAEEGGRS
jgi:hypothetical protein